MANQKKWLDENGLLYLWGKIKSLVPTKTSALLNDSGYITGADVPEGAAASTTLPKMAGTTANAGTENAFARGDHIHPKDTSKVDKEDGKGLSSNDYTDTEKSKLGGIEAGANKYVLPNATTTVTGGVMLSTETNDSSTSKAATPSAVKAAYDLANSKQSPATTLAGYNIGDAYTKAEVDGLVSSALHYKGTKENYSDLPQSGNKVGDVWNITNASPANGVNAGDNVAWNGTEWDVLAGTVDLSAYLLVSDVVAITNAEIDTLCV